MQTRRTDEFHSLLLGHRFCFGATQDGEHRRELDPIMHQSQTAVKLVARRGPLSVRPIASHHWQIDPRPELICAEIVAIAQRTRVGIDVLRDACRYTRINRRAIRVDVIISRIRVYKGRIVP